MWQARRRYQERLRYFRRNVSGGWGLRALPTAVVRSWGPLNAWPRTQCSWGGWRGERSCCILLQGWGKEKVPGVSACQAGGLWGG